MFRKLLLEMSMFELIFALIASAIWTYFGYDFTDMFIGVFIVMIVCNMIGAYRKQ